MNLHKNFDVKWEDKSQVDEMVGAKDTQWTQLTELLVFLKPQSVISPATCFHIDLKSACLPRGHLPADGNVHSGPLGMSHHLRFCSTSWGGVCLAVVVTQLLQVATLLVDLFLPHFYTFHMSGLPMPYYLGMKKFYKTKIGIDSTFLGLSTDL